MSKPNKGQKPIKLTINNILDAYANASREGDTDPFWRFVQEANNQGMLPISVKDIEAMLQQNHGNIQGRKYQLDTEGRTSPSGRYGRRENK